MLGTYHLTVLYDVLKDLHFLHQNDKIYGFLLEQLTKSLDADAATIFIADDKRENLTLKASIGGKKQIFEMVAGELPFPFGKGLCGWVAKFNQPVIVDDAAKDQRFNGQVDTLTGYKTKGILCAPLAIGDDVLGVIEILNKKSAVFNKNDLDLVAVIARQTAIALQNARLIGELESVKNFDESVLSNLPGGFIAADAQGKLTYLNASAEKILYLVASEAVDKPGADVLKNYPALWQALSETMASQQSKTRQETPCEKPDKTLFTVGYSTFLIQDKSGKLLGAGLNFQDLSQFKS